MKQEKTAVHELVSAGILPLGNNSQIHETVLAGNQQSGCSQMGLAGIALQAESSQKTRNSTSWQSTQRMLVKKSNWHHGFDIYLAGKSQHRSKFLIYFVSFVLFVDEKRFLA